METFKVALKYMEINPPSLIIGMQIKPHRDSLLTYQDANSKTVQYKFGGAPIHRPLYSWLVKKQNDRSLTCRHVQLSDITTGYPQSHCSLELFNQATKIIIHIQALMCVRARAHTHTYKLKMVEVYKLVEPLIATCSSMLPTGQTTVDTPTWRRQWQ